MKDDTTKIHSLRMNTAEARDVIFALLVESANSLHAANTATLTGMKQELIKASRRMLDVRQRIEMLLTPPGTTGQCMHGVSFGVQCQRCAAHFPEPGEDSLPFPRPQAE